MYRKHKRKNRGGNKGTKVPKFKGVFGNMSNIEKSILETKVVNDLTPLNILSVRMVRKYC